MVLSFSLLQSSNERAMLTPLGLIRSVRCVALFCGTALAALLVQAASAQPAKTFVSKQYGYSIVLPGDSGRWDARLAVVTWSVDVFDHDSPAFDDFTDHKTGRFYFLAARPYGSSLARWTKFVVSARPGICGAPRLMSNTSLAGASARMVTWLCSDGYRVLALTALHSRRGYVMLMASPTAVSRVSDLSAFDAARRSFRFPRN
jgi:hypothetical protein